MKILFVTIALDGMPFITHHLPMFNQLSPEIDWRWSVVEGVAEPVLDTAWCRRILPRVSVDQTHQYMKSLAPHPRVRFKSSPSWPGKTAQINAALDDGPYDLVWQIDSDEIWTAEQIEKLAHLFNFLQSQNCADFRCRYFVGPNIVVDRTPGTWTNDEQIMWRRVWRWAPGFKFASHEPPIVENQERVPMTHDQTEGYGLIFDHYAYVLERQVFFKEVYYGYNGAVQGWRRLQKNTQWPARLGDFLPWVKDGTTASKLYES